MKSISIVTAAYNECPGIIHLINEWLIFIHQHPSISAGEVILCDDFSDMNQYEKLKNTFASHPQVTILRNEKNEGPGFSLNRSMRMAKYDWTLITDSDGQFPIENLNTILDLMQNSTSQAIFTFRNRKYDNEFNRFGQKISNLICNRIFHSNLKDFSCAFKLVKTSVLQEIKFDARFMNYSLDHTAKILISAVNYQEVGISCKVAKTKKRKFFAEINRAKNRFFYIGYLYFTAFLVKNKIIF